MPLARTFPHVAEAKAKDFDTGQSLHLLWTRFHNLTDGHDSNKTTITSLQTQLQEANEALDALQVRVRTITPEASTTTVRGAVPPDTSTTPPDVDSLLSDVSAARASYGATMTADECVALLNQVAWDNQADGWGLLEKSGGNHGAQPTTGTFCSVDLLYHQPTTSLWDCLGSAGDSVSATPGAATPQWLFNSDSPGADFVAPVTP